jgi:hypothetical protein
VINFGSKAKSVKKPKKKVRKASSRVPRRPEGYFNDALTPEDIAEINLFSRLIAQENAKYL